MKSVIIPFFFVLSFFFMGCASNSFDPTFEPNTGCILQPIKLKNQSINTGYVGYCLDDKIIARWAVEEKFGQTWYQIEVDKNKKVTIKYKTRDNVWFVWSEKGGLNIKIPQEFQPDQLVQP